MTSVLVSHPRGNENVRQVLEALRSAGALHSYHTTLGWSGMTAVSKLAAAYSGQLGRRAYTMVPPDQLFCHQAMRELVRIGLSRAPSLKLRGQANFGRSFGLLGVAKAYDAAVAD